MATRKKTLERQLTELNARLKEVELERDDAERRVDGLELSLASARRAPKHRDVPLTPFGRQQAGSASERDADEGVEGFSARLEVLCADEEGDMTAFDRWMKKFYICARAGRWSQRRQLLEFTFHLGGRAERLYELIEDERKGTLEEAVAALRERLAPPELAGLLARKFHHTWQAEKESVDSFVARMEGAFRDSYGRDTALTEVTKDALLLNHFVQHVSRRFAEKVAHATGYAAAVQIARMEEARLKQLRDLRSLREGEVQREAPMKSDRGPTTSVTAGARGVGNRPPRSEGLKCFSCGNQGHKARFCPTAAGRPQMKGPGPWKPPARVATVEAVSDLTLEDLQREVKELRLQLEAKQVNKVTESQGALIKTEILIKNVPFEATVDSGSAVTIVAADVLDRLKKETGMKPKLSPPDSSLYGFGGHQIPISAVTNLPITWKGSTVEVPVFVRPPGHGADQSPCLLGTNTIFTLGMLKISDDVMLSGDGNGRVHVQDEEQYVTRVEAEAIGEVDEAVRLNELKERWKVSSDLRPEQRRKLGDLLAEFSDVFAVDASEVQTVQWPATEHIIDTCDQPPIKQHPQRVPYAQRDEISRQTETMLDQNVIEPSNSPWASPVVLVEKKDGSVRFCVDYRRLNGATKKDVYPLPRIDDLLEKTAGKQYFTTLDAKSGYWQIPMAEDSKEKTAFATNDGLYQFRVMPFGLCNAPATYQRLMQQAFSDIPFAVEYLDDLNIASSDFDEHLEHLREVLERCRKMNLKLNPKKCSFAGPQALFLGHVVSAGGVAPDPEKVAAVAKFAVPGNLTALREFLGLASYYRRYVENFATIASPLHRLTRKNIPFEWNADCDIAFQRLKTLLCKAPVLATPNFSCKFQLHTDASYEGLGAVLEQEQADGTTRPVAYASRSLLQHEKNYGVTELEALALVWAVKYFRVYLLGHATTVLTDHAPLKSFLTRPQTNAKLTRWSTTLSEFNLDIQYRPGKKNANADALSRSPLPADTAPVTVSTITEQDSSGEKDPCNVELMEQQKKDETLLPIIQFIETGVLPDNDREARKLLLQREDFTLLDGVLYYLDHKKGCRRLAVPKEQKQKLMEETHSGKFGGHFAEHSTYTTLSKAYWWNGMYADIVAHCKGCLTCAARSGGGRRPATPLQSIPVSGAFDLMAVDVMQLPTTLNGNQYVAVFSEYLTKWVEVFAIPNQRAETIARLFVEQVICRYGVPSRLLSDRGSNFLSDLMRQVCRIMGVKKVNTTAYHPQTDGLVERFNRSLREMLAKYGRHYGAEWDRHLPYLLFAYRTRVHSSTKESPFFLLFGRDPRIPTETALSQPRHRYQVDMDDYILELVSGLTQAWRIAHESVMKSQESQKRQHDKVAKERNMSVGDRVMVHMPHLESDVNRKMALPHHGPYRIVDSTASTVKIVPVNQPDADPILVNKARVSRCSRFLQTDEPWLGDTKRSRTSKKTKQATAIESEQVVAKTTAKDKDHQYPLRNTKARQELKELEAST